MSVCECMCVCASESVSVSDRERNPRGSPLLCWWRSLCRVSCLQCLPRGYTHPFNSLKVAKCFCVQNTEKEGYESLEIIVFSKEKKKKTVIESMDDEDIRIPAVFQTQTLLDVYNFNFINISIDTKRQKTAMPLFQSSLWISVSSQNYAIKTSMDAPWRIWWGCTRAREGVCSPGHFTRPNIVKYYQR